MKCNIIVLIISMLFFNVSCDICKKKNDGRKNQNKAVDDKKIDMSKLTFFSRVKGVNQPNILISGYYNKQNLYAAIIYDEKNIYFYYDEASKKYCVTKIGKQGFKEPLQKNHIYYYDGKVVHKCKIKQLDEAEFDSALSKLNQINNFEDIKSIFKN
ncbi:hypothetical protein AAEX28_15435 [Lentisphaerota bacterium WC36G]|nr:hypothetical protein LJT99_02190 [Lentisphaerae bacterium WC36]